MQTQEKAAGITLPFDKNGSENIRNREKGGNNDMWSYSATPENEPRQQSYLKEKERKK